MGKSASLGGIAYVKMGGVQLALKGELELDAEMIEESAITGNDGVHGFVSKARAPSFSGKFTLTPNLTIEQIRAIKDEAWTVETNGGGTWLFNTARVTDAMKITTESMEFNMTVVGKSAKRIA